MKLNDYWILEKNDVDIVHDLCLSDKNIVEITYDGLVFIWPFEPNRDALCYVCLNCPYLPDKEFAEYRKIHCLPKAGSTQPCNFVPVEQIDNQDIDDFIIDGDYVDCGGYFTDLNDYLYRCNIPAFAFKRSHLGQFESIRAARAKLRQYLDL